MRRNFWLSGIGIFLLLLVLAACGSNEDNEDSSASESTENNEDQDTLDLGKKEINLATDNYVSNTANTYIVKQMLEEIGYNVHVYQTDVGVQYVGLAEASADASVSAWLPEGQKDHWEKYKDDLELVSTVTEDVDKGLVVPSYMKDINSIEDLADNKNGIGDELNWEIVGHGPGSAQMDTTIDEVLPEYEMDEWNVITSSGPVKATELENAIDNEEPIVTVLWTPHWTFNKHDLKMLEDPKNIFPEPDDIKFISRKGFEEDSPAAHKLMSQFKITKSQTEETMMDLQDDMGDDEAAQKFLENYPDLKEEWMKDIKIEN